jgi:hypothetical protein
MMVWYYLPIWIQVEEIEPGEYTASIPDLDFVAEANSPAEAAQRLAEQVFLELRMSQ